MSCPVKKACIVISAFTIFLIMAGCADMGRATSRATRIDLAALDTGAAIRAANHDAGWPADRWWQTYRDPQLDTWIATAQAGNPSLAQAQARVAEAQAMARIAEAALLPQLNGNLSLQRQHWPRNIYYGPGALADSTAWNNTGTLNLSYHLDVWGADANQAAQARNIARARAADARAARLELEVNIVRAYINLSMHYTLVDIAQETLKRQQQLADLARQRLRAGMGTQLELNQTEATLPEYERQIEVLNQAIALERNQLAALAGQGPGAGASLARPTLALNTSTGLPSALPAELIGRRPDVVAARWRIEAQARGIDIAKAAFYPNINLLGSLGGFAVSASLTQFLKGYSSGWSVGPALTLPIFEGGRLRAQLGAAAANYDEAIERYNQIVITALQDVANQVVQVRSLEIQRQDAARAIAATRKSYMLSYQGFRRGLTDYVNVLIAQNQLLSAQDNAARVQAAQLTAHASLMAALGGGFDEPDSNASSASPATNHH